MRALVFASSLTIASSLCLTGCAAVAKFALGDSSVHGQVERLDSAEARAEKYMGTISKSEVEAGASAWEKA